MATGKRSFDELLQAIKEEIAEVIVPEDIESWLSTENPLFDERRPTEILLEDGEEGYNMIHASIEASKEGIHL